jgi:RNA polymerase sigma-70 factor (ECF subfamily)
VETRPDEADLIARSRKGDLAAFNVLVEHYQKAVYNLCLRLLGNPQVAEDTTQDAFISAYRRLDSFRGGSFRSWLFRIATNASYDELRWRRSRPSVSMDEPAAEGERAFDVADKAPLPADRAEQAELRRAIDQALAQLPQEQRLAIVLCDVEGLDYAEIAEVMRCSLGTVKSRIARGRARLRVLLLEREELLPSRFRPTGEET